MDNESNSTLTEMAKACMQGDTETVKKLLANKGATPDNDNDIDYSTPVQWTDSDGEALCSPPLFIAVDYGHLDTLCALLDDAGISVDSKDDRGYTPLQWASWNGQQEIVQILIERGAKVDEDALDLAKEYDHKDIAALLFQHVDLYSEIEGNDDAVMEKACRQGDLSKVQELMRKGYDLQKWKDEEGGFHR